MSGNVHRTVKWENKLQTYGFMFIQNNRDQENLEGRKEILQFSQLSWVELLKLMLNLAFFSGVGLCVRFLF